jgi:hypothetical protein
MTVVGQHKEIQGIASTIRSVNHTTSSLGAKLYHLAGQNNPADALTKINATVPLSDVCLHDVDAFLALPASWDNRSEQPVMTDYTVLGESLTKAQETAEQLSMLIRKEDTKGVDHDAIASKVKLITHTSPKHQASESVATGSTPSTNTPYTNTPSSPHTQQDTNTSTFIATPILDLSSSSGEVAAGVVESIAIESSAVDAIDVGKTSSASHDVQHVDDECNDVYSYSPSNAPLPHCLYLSWQEFCNQEYGVLDGSALSHDQQISLQLEAKSSKEMTSEETEREAKRYDEVTNTPQHVRALDALVRKRQRLADWLCGSIRDVDAPVRVGPISSGEEFMICSKTVSRDDVARAFSKSRYATGVKVDLVCSSYSFSGEDSVPQQVHNYYEYDYFRELLLDDERSSIVVLSRWGKGREDDFVQREARWELLHRDGESGYKTATALYRRCHWPAGLTGIVGLEANCLLKWNPADDAEYTSSETDEDHRLFNSDLLPAMMAHLVKHRFKIVFVLAPGEMSDTRLSRVMQHKLMILSDKYGIPFDALLFQTVIQQDFWIMHQFKKYKELFQEVFELQREWPTPPQMVSRRHSLLWNMFRSEEGELSYRAPWISWSWDIYLQPSVPATTWQITTHLPEPGKSQLKVTKKGNSVTVATYASANLSIHSRATTWSKVPRDLLWNSMGVSEVHELSLASRRLLMITGIHHQFSRVAVTKPILKPANVFSTEENDSSMEVKTNDGDGNDSTLPVLKRASSRSSRSSRVSHQTDYRSGHTGSIVSRQQRNMFHRTVRFADTGLPFLPEATAILYVHDNEIVHFWRRHRKDEFGTTSIPDESHTPVWKVKVKKGKRAALHVTERWPESIPDDDLEFPDFDDSPEQQATVSTASSVFTTAVEDEPDFPDF